MNNDNRVTSFSQLVPYNTVPEFVDECEIIPPSGVYDKCKSGTFVLCGMIIYKDEEPFINLIKVVNSPPINIRAFDYNGGLKLFAIFGSTTIYDCIEKKLIQTAFPMYIYAGIVIMYNSAERVLTVFGENFKYFNLVNNIFTSEGQTKYTIHKIGETYINHIRELGSSSRTKPAIRPALVGSSAGACVWDELD